MTRDPRGYIPSARCLAVWRQCYAQYLPKNDARGVHESRFSGSHGPSLSFFFILNSLIAHRYHYSSCNTRIETGRSIVDSFVCPGILDRAADSLHSTNPKLGAFGPTLVHPLMKLLLIRGPSSAKHLPRFW